ncbi:Planctomycete cytochrome C [Sphingobacterium nematocida]|uniref:Planctomycete cytochrome C n=1 Tax=Sphingobacterium nematocida TaxID=1513896 RepID=A0A1T5BP05_9SPHI|nr:c-type cytochrome domain-containing protein [Sphingobacterium nematocida]SKB48855.1 Planctomycete cytochrome C [Sphingobacterium nematocida]
MKKRVLVISIILIGVLGIVFFSIRKERPVDFSAEVKPIINKHCISCHGGVKANGGLSLLFEEEAFAKTESGSPSIIRGDADHSEFIKRLITDDPELRMPYNAISRYV